jgi:hypothetical protein
VNQFAHAGSFALTARQREARAGIELLVLCNTITENGRLFDDELAALDEWKQTHRESTLQGREQLTHTIDRILADGMVGDAERAELREVVDRILPLELRQTVKRKRGLFDSGEHARIVPTESYNFILASARGDRRSAEVARYATDGDEVLLVRDPQNRHSRNAIFVRLLSGHDAGYVPEAEARTLAPLLDKNLRYSASIRKTLSDFPLPVPMIVAHVYADDAQVEGVRRPNDLKGPALAFVANTPARAVPAVTTNYTPIIVFAAVAFLVALVLISL